jgi:release factor glutamine methyltransferase
MTLADLQRELILRMKGADFPQATFEIRQIFQQALHLDSAQLIVNESTQLTREEEDRIRYWVKARLDGQPLAYLSGRKGFYKDEFLVEPGVLVPRPETEFIVTQAVKLKPDAGSIADYGCGSGCIGLSLVKEFSQAQLWALDASPKAIEVTLKNAEHIGVADRVQVILCDVVGWSPDSPLDLVVANPPYIANDDPTVEPGVHKYEPHEALYSGPDGLAAIRAWSAHAFKFLAPGGLFVSEFGAGQSPAVREIMAKIGFVEMEFVRDLAGHERVVSAFKR